MIIIMMISGNYSRNDFIHIKCNLNRNTHLRSLICILTSRSPCVFPLFVRTRTPDWYHWFNT